MFSIYNYCFNKNYIYVKIILFLIVLFSFTVESVLGTTVQKSVKKKTASKQKSNKDFNVEYAKSGRAVCCGCQDKIVKV